MTRLLVSVPMLVIGTALLLGAGIAHSAGGTAEARKGGTLRIASTEDLRVDPALAYLADEWMVEYATCAKLFNHPDRPGAAGLRVVPEVVRSFTVSRDRRTYTLALHETFRFHTGARVTAESYADAFNRNAQPGLQSPATQYMREIVGAQAVMSGRAQSISGVQVLGRYRLQVRLTRPVGDFTARLTMPFFCPILQNTPATELHEAAGSGPYYVAERIVNQRTVLERNPYYRGKRPANVDQVIWTAGVELEECQRAVEQDRIDFCGTPGAPRTAYPVLAERYGVNRPGGRVFVRSPDLATWFFAFNHDRPAFDGPGQVPLKKAINYAIDRPALAGAFGYRAGRRTDQMLPPLLGRPESIYPRAGADPVEARRWYAKPRIRPTRLVLYAWTIPPAVVAAQILAYNLKQLGIELEIKYFAPQTVVDRARMPDEPFDIVLSAWGADYADGSALLVPLLDRGGRVNVVNLADPRLERRIDAASRLAPGEARRRAWANLDVDLMRNDPPWAPFMHANSRWFVSQSLGCFLDHPIYHVDIAAVCKR